MFTKEDMVAKCSVSADLVKRGYDVFETRNREKTMRLIIESEKELIRIEVISGDNKVPENDYDVLANLDYETGKINYSDTL